VMMKVIPECRVIPRERHQARKEVCDSTGWPEGPKGMPEGHESHFSCSNGNHTRIYWAFLWKVVSFVYGAKQFSTSSVNFYDRVLFTGSLIYSMYDRQILMFINL
jgi:hypothetical protein